MPFVLSQSNGGQKTGSHGFRIKALNVFSLRCLLGCLFCLMAINVADAADDPFAEQTLRAGFYAQSFPDFSVEDIEISVKLLTEEIAKEEGVQASVKVYEDIQAMRQDFDKGIINFVVASSILLATEFDIKLFGDGFRFVRLTESPDRLLVLGQTKSGKDGFASFRGQRLVLAQSDPMTELYLDFLSWSHFKQSYKNSFKLIKREKIAHQLILMLFFGKADVTCVYQNAYETAVEMNPQLKQKLTILSQTENVPQGMGLFHKNTPKVFSDKIIAETLELHNRPRGRQLLELFKSEQAVHSDVGNLAAVIELYRSHQRLIGKE